MRTLVLAECAEGVLSDSSSRAVTAALQLGGCIDAILFESAGECVAAEELAQLKGVQVVYSVNAGGECVIAEQFCKALLAVKADLEREGEITHIVMSSSALGRELIPRLAAVLDVSPVTDVIEIVDPKTFVRPIYSGSVLETVRCSTALTLLTVRAVAFDRCPQGGTASVIRLKAKVVPIAKYIVKRTLPQSVRPELSRASMVVTGGRGVGSKEQFEALVGQLADRLGAAVGATRVVVDDNIAPNELQIGQTGRVVAPELYIAVGVSGAIQHLAGMKGSRTIVAINKDAEAPMCRAADYVLIGDAEKLVPELIEALDHAGVKKV